MGRTGMRRHQQAALAEETITPPEQLASSQIIGRICSKEGNHIYKCEVPGNEMKPKLVLVQMETRFRGIVLVTVGNFVLIDLFAEEDKSKNTKIQGSIINIVRDEKIWRKQNYWPAQFAKASSSTDDNPVGSLPPSDSEDEEE
jgi:probable RNA-binding protein EIF1AD